MKLSLLQFQTILLMCQLMSCFVRSEVTQSTISCKSNAKSYSSDASKKSSNFLQPLALYVNKNANESDMVTLNRSGVFTDLLVHPCNSSIALYLSTGRLYLTMNGFQSHTFPLKVNKNSLKTVHTEVSSASFVLNRLLLVIQGDVHSYDWVSGTLTQSTGISGSVTSVGSFLQCEDSGVWSGRQNDIVVAYRDDTPTDNFYLSQDAGLHFSKTSLSVTQNVNLYRITVLGSGHSVSALVKTSSSQAQFITISIANSTAKSELAFSVSSDDVLAFTQCRSGFGTFLIWDSVKLYYSSNNGQTVEPVRLNKVAYRSDSGFLQTDELFSRVIANRQGDFIAFTNKSHLYFGREGFYPEYVEVYNHNAELSSESVFEFDQDGYLLVLTPSNGTDKLIIQRQHLDVQSAVWQITPALPTCQYQTLESNLTRQNIYYMDHDETLVFHTKIVPQAWKDQKLIVSVSDPNLIETKSEIIREEIPVKGVHSKHMMTHVKQRGQLITDTVPNSKKSGVASIRISTIANSLTCSKNPLLVARVGVGCPPGKNIRVRKNNTENEECTRGNYNYTIPASAYDPTYMRGMFGNHGAVSKTALYNYTLFRCPFTSYHSDTFKPVIELYDGDRFVEQVRVDFVVYEIHGISKHSYSKLIQGAGCKTTPQTWESMLSRQSQPDPATAWNNKNYESCKKPADLTNPTAEDGYVPSGTDPYEILHADTDNSITWSGYNGIFIFEAIVMDPLYSFCDLRARFAVEVYGAPPSSDIAVLLVSGIIIVCVLTCLFISYSIVLYVRHYHSSESQESVMLHKLDLSEIQAHLEKKES